MNKITSVKNETVKNFKALFQKNRRKEQGLFIIEGKIMLLEAVKSGYTIDAVFVEEFVFLEEELVAQLIKNGTQMYEVTPNVLGAMSDTKTPQGIVASCKVKVEEEGLPLGRCVLLDNLQDPGNMGTIIRTAEALGIDGVIAVNCVDIYNPKVIRSTMGSLFRQKIIEVSSGDEVIETMKNMGYHIYAAVLNDEAKSIKTICWETPCCVMIGNEAKGISRDLVVKSHQQVYIDMVGKAESLNAAIAASIMMWEMKK